MALLQHPLVIFCVGIIFMTRSYNVVANNDNNGVGEIYDLEEHEYVTHDDPAKRQANSLCP